MVPSPLNHEDAVTVDDMLRVLVVATSGAAREVEAGAKPGRVVFETPTAATTASSRKQAKARMDSSMARDSGPIRCAVALGRNLTRVGVRDNRYSQSGLNRQITTLTPLQLLVLLLQPL